jgi:FkbM family methyltransferase
VKANLSHPELDIAGAKCIPYTRYGAIAAPSSDEDLIVQFLEHYGEWSQLEVEFLSTLLPTRARVLDIGAYLGTFSMGLSQLVDLEFVALVEGNRAVVPLLMRNVDANLRCPHEVVPALAVAPDSPTVTEGWANAGNAGSASFVGGGRNDDADGLRIQPVLDRISLDELMHRFAPIHLVKLDVEGMENELLRSSRGILSDSTVLIWAECNEAPGSLELAQALLNTQRPLHYCAWPSHNVKNHAGTSSKIFPFAYEAGLLLGGEYSILLSESLEESGCILRRIMTMKDLREALWITPRWAPSEWDSLQRSELAGVASKLLLGKRQETFLCHPQGETHTKNDLPDDLVRTSLFQQATLVRLQDLLGSQTEQHLQYVRNAGRAMEEAERRVPQHYLSTWWSEGKGKDKALTVESPAGSEKLALCWAATTVLSRPDSNFKLTLGRPENVGAGELLGRLLETLVGTIISVSQDDYVIATGGVQNVISDECAEFRRRGVPYLHLCPARPLRRLAQVTDSEEFTFAVRLNGDALGRLSAAALAQLLSKLKAASHPVGWVIHHLMGHSPEVLRALIDVQSSAPPLFWVHDFFAACESYALMRNDLAFCGGPSPTSAACRVCIHGERRINHRARIAELIQGISPEIVAPSQSAIEIWIRTTGVSSLPVHIVPPARLRAVGSVRRSATRKRVRVAYVGAQVSHKGWGTFSKLTEAFQDDDRYEFYQLGEAGTVLQRVRHIPVRVSGEHRDAMIQALAFHNIDAVVSWSMWPETFCFTTHEAIASGTFLVYRRHQGHVDVAAQVHAPDAAHAVEDEDELHGYLRSGGLLRDLTDAPRRDHLLVPSAGSAELLSMGLKIEAYRESGMFHQRIV